jgi:hypothetical protein
LGYGDQNLMNALDYLLLLGRGEFSQAECLALYFDPS